MLAEAVVDGEVVAVSDGDADLDGDGDRDELGVSEGVIVVLGVIQKTCV